MQSQPILPLIPDGGQSSPPPKPYRVARYRLALVREGSSMYDPETDDVPVVAPEAIARWLAARIFDVEPREVMAVVYLNVRHRIIGWTVAYQGALSRATVEPRGILVPALLANAAGIIIAHNHPSGDPAPSAEDFAFTRRLAEAGEVVGIRLLDHLIIGTDSGRWVALSRVGGWA